MEKKKTGVFKRAERKSVHKNYVDFVQKNISEKLTFIFLLYLIQSFSVMSSVNIKHNNTFVICSTRQHHFTHRLAVWYTNPVFYRTVLNKHWIFVVIVCFRPTQFLMVSNLLKVEEKTKKKNKTRTKCIEKKSVLR